MGKPAPVRRRRGNPGWRESLPLARSRYHQSVIMIANVPCAAYFDVHFRPSALPTLLFILSQRSFRAVACASCCGRREFEYIPALNCLSEICDGPKRPFTLHYFEKGKSSRSVCRRDWKSSCSSGVRTGASGSYPLSDTPLRAPRSGNRWATASSFGWPRIPVEDP